MDATSLALGGAICILIFGVLTTRLYAAQISALKAAADYWQDKCRQLGGV